MEPPSIERRAQVSSLAMRPLWTARERCYHTIRNVMGQGMVDYYQQNRTLLGDDRSQKAIKASRDGLAAILAVLDQFDISEKTAPDDVVK